MRLTGGQMFWLIFTFHIGNIILLTISPAIQEAKQDAWMSYLIASVLGILIMDVATRTAMNFPNHTLIQFSKLILGKWLGTIVILIYFAQWYSLVPVILRESSNFINTTLLPETPAWIITLSMILLVVYVTNIGGIEGISRCSEVFGPIIILFILVMGILLIKDYNSQNLLPVYADTGIFAIWKGALSPLSFLGESVIILMLVSFVNKGDDVRKGALLGTAFAALLTSVIAISVLLIFGPEISAKILYPAFDVVSYIFILDFLQNVEILAAFIWILSVFIKLSTYFFLVCYGTAQLFNMKNWKWLISLFASAFFILSQLIPNVSFVLDYAKTYGIHFTLPVNMIGIPLLLWITGNIRKKNTVKE